MTYPTITPKLTLDFANSRQLDPRITFSRSSSATYLHPDTELITTAPSGVARFEKEGFLIEEARTNSFQYSTELDNAYWDRATGLTKTANNAVSPDGNTTALLVTEDTSTGEHVFGKSTNVSVSNNCMSIFVKPNGKTRVGLRQGNEATANVIFDLSGTGSVVSGNGCIKQYPNGWFRVTQSRQSTGNKTFFHLLNDADDALSYTGDGTSGCWIWGYQKEAGTFPSSLIPTAGSTVTRAVDLVSMTGTEFSSWYNNSEGTFLCEFNHPFTAHGDDRIFMAASSNASADRIGAAIRNTYQITYALAKTNSVNILADTMTGTDASLSPTLGVGYSSATDGFRWVQQDVVRTATGTPSTAIDRLLIGQTNASASDNKLSGHITRLSYYDRRVSDAELETLTS